MDSSNIVHFCFSFAVPMGWAIILRPFSRMLFRSWSGFLFTVLLLSLAAICGKEWLDAEPSVNDIVADILGFFLGIALITDYFYRREKTVDRAEEREVAGHRVSLRSTLSLIEKIERRSAEFYRKAAESSPSTRASGLCLLLANDANKRAKRVAFTLFGWKNRRDSEELTAAVENAFSSQKLFSLDVLPSSTPKEVLQIALEHEKKKLSLFTKLEGAFHEEWKVMQLEAILAKLSKEIRKLELCLAELDKESRPG